MSKPTGGLNLPNGQIVIEDPCPAMTLRDYFAANAMQGMIASGITTDIDGEYVFQRRAKMAYVVADAMIAERDK